MSIPGNNSTEDGVERQDIHTLKRRYDELNKKKIRAETEKASSERRLAELQRKARDRYGTDDLDALREKLEAMKVENERRRREYQEHLDGIEAKLQEVEAAHQEASEQK